MKLLLIRLALEMLLAIAGIDTPLETESLIQIKFSSIGATMKILASLLSRIPASCPFARDVHLLHITLHIPPLCKLNPFYNQLMAARWWALEYLEEQK